MSIYSTIEGFEKMTAQEVFDKAARHLLTQGQVSMSSTQMCKYRGPNGLMCAAGPFLRDDRAPDLEGMSWSELAHRGHVPETHAGLVAALQEVHDGLRIYAKQWPDALRMCADRFQLSPAVLEEFNS